MARMIPAAVAASLMLLEAAAIPAASARKSGSVVEIGSSGPRFRGAPISLDLQDAELSDVLLSFAKIAKANIVVDPGVEGTVTVRLTHVPWDQALDLIVRMNGYAWSRDGGIVRIGVPSKLR